MMYSNRLPVKRLPHIECHCSLHFSFRWSNTKKNLGWGHRRCVSTPVGVRLTQYNTAYSVRFNAAESSWLELDRFNDKNTCSQCTRCCSISTSRRSEEWHETNDNKKEQRKNRVNMIVLCSQTNDDDDVSWIANWPHTYLLLYYGSVVFSYSLCVPLFFVCVPRVAFVDFQIIWFLKMRHCNAERRQTTGSCCQIAVFDAMHTHTLERVQNTFLSC